MMTLENGGLSEPTAPEPQNNIRELLMQQMMMQQAQPPGAGMQGPGGPTVLPTGLSNAPLAPGAGAPGPTPNPMMMAQALRG